MLPKHLFIALCAIFSLGFGHAAWACSDDPPACVERCRAEWDPQITVAQLDLDAAVLRRTNLEQQIQDILAQVAAEDTRHGAKIAAINALLITASLACDTRIIPQEVLICLAAAIATADAALLDELNTFNVNNERLHAQFNVLRGQLTEAIAAIVLKQEVLIQKLNGKRICLEGCVPCPAHD